MRSGALTSGHRRLGAREIAITTADYEQRLRDHGVILSADERRNRILSGMTGIRYRPDPALLETLVYFTECPQPIAGSFDPQFLELPEEVLVTVMRHHQRYFSVEDAGGRLAPQFVAVMNIESDPEGFVRRGNERVLRARFNDARLGHRCIDDRGVGRLLRETALWFPRRNGSHGSAHFKSSSSQREV